MNLSFKIRKVLRSDLPCIAEIHRRAFPESFLTVLGQESVERYYAWLLTGPHETVALTAETKEKLLGFCFGGVFRGALSGFLRKNKGSLFISLATHPAVFFNPEAWKKIFQGLRVILKPQAAAAESHDRVKSFGILSVAVDPQVQSQGVGRGLMMESEKTAESLGYREMDLTVHVKNVKAVCFYEKLGWMRREPWTGRMSKKIL